MSTEAENRDRVREMLWAINDPLDKDAAITEVVALIASEEAAAEVRGMELGMEAEHNIKTFVAAHPIELPESLRGETAMTPSEPVRCVATMQNRFDEPPEPCNRPIREREDGGWEHFGRGCLHPGCKINHRPHAQHLGHPPVAPEGARARAGHG